jgi:Type II intron maturase
MRHGKPVHLAQRTIDEAYIVQYYRMTYNLHTLSELKYMAEVSLVKTLAKKFKTTCAKIYRRYGTKIKTDDGEYKVILVKIDRDPPKKPLISYFGGVSLKWNKWVSINDELTEPIWNHRSELVQRLLAQECELCGSHESIEVHHIRKLADLKPKDGSTQPRWKIHMSEIKRKTLIVCHRCHRSIQYGKYDGNKISA